MEPEHSEAPPRVLIVEDEWLIAMDLQDKLEEAGYCIVGPAHSVTAALDMIARESLDAGLLDLHVGSETSYTIAEALKRRGIPFAFLTGHSRADLDTEFHNEPLMCKPVSVDELTAGLKALLQAGRCANRSCLGRPT